MRHVKVAITGSGDSAGCELTCAGAAIDTGAGAGAGVGMVAPAVCPARIAASRAATEPGAAATSSTPFLYAQNASFRYAEQQAL